jgi:hypothetical protein
MKLLSMLLNLPTETLVTAQHVHDFALVSDELTHPGDTSVGLIRYALLDLAHFMENCSWQHRSTLPLVKTPIKLCFYR